jgi:transposase
MYEQKLKSISYSTFKAVRAIGHPTFLLPCKMSKRGSYVTLTVEQKLSIVREAEEAQKKGEVAKKYGISASTLSTFIKNKRKLEEKVDEGGGKKKRLRELEYPDIDTAVFQWFKQMRSQNVPINGPLLQSKAQRFADLLHHTNFKASSGWFTKFTQRHGISYKQVCGEGAAVDFDAVQKWKDELPKLLAKYRASDIFNADELGLFYKCTPDKTYTMKGEQCKGGKTSKERVTVLVGANMDGSEKLPLLMIGKSRKPRCFKGVKSLPLDYTANNKAWMTGSIFENYQLYRKIVKNKIYFS